MRAGNRKRRLGSHDRMNGSDIDEPHSVTRRSLPAEDAPDFDCNALEMDSVASSL